MSFWAEARSCAKLSFSEPRLASSDLNLPASLFAFCRLSSDADALACRYRYTDTSAVPDSLRCVNLCHASLVGYHKARSKSNWKHHEQMVMKRRPCCWFLEGIIPMMSLDTALAAAEPLGVTNPDQGYAMCIAFGCHALP